MKQFIVALALMLPLAVFAEGENGECDNFDAPQICDTGYGDPGNPGDPGVNDQWPYGMTPIAITGVPCPAAMCYLRSQYEATGVEHILAYFNCGTGGNYDAPNCQLQKGGLYETTVNQINFQGQVTDFRYVYIFVRDKLTNPDRLVIDVGLVCNNRTTIC